MGKDVPKHQPGNGNRCMVKNPCSTENLDLTIENTDLASSKIGGQLINCCCFMLFKKWEIPRINIHGPCKVSLKNWLVIVL
jgi:hypothetical protein